MYLQVVYPPATERFARNVQSKDVTIKPFDKFAHDIYLDTSKVSFLPRSRYISYICNKFYIGQKPAGLYLTFGILSRHSWPVLH